MRCVFPTALASLLSACGVEQNALMEPLSVAPPASDRLYAPNEVTNGKLQYARDGQPFAPVMTRRHPYPSQAQANFALERSRWNEVFQRGHPDVSIRIFACRPGALNGATGRTIASGEAAAVCATDILDGAGQTMGRVPLNFYYADHAWRVHDPDPSYAPPAWSNREPSPPRRTSWFGDRY